MKFWRITFVVCLVGGLSSLLHAQSEEKLPPADCPAACSTVAVVDLCKLAKDLSPIDKPWIAIRTETLDHKKQINLVKHDELAVSFAKRQQVAWTCNDRNAQSFQILSIEKVRAPNGVKYKAVPGAPDFPFCPSRQKDILTEQKPAVGAKVLSGPPVSGAVGQWYKYSFRVTFNTPKGPDIKKIDPHVIVTDPGIGGRYGMTPCASPGPNPRGEKPNNKK